MPLQEVRECPICESRRLKPAFQVHYWKEHLLSYSDCLECGATFADPMPNDEVIAAGNNALVRLYQQGRSPEQEFREARQAYLKGKLLGRRLSRWKKKGKLLELGCFHGFFSLGVKENSDWEVEGLEISSDLTGFVRDTLGLTCHLGTLESAALPENYYDFIVCHDLIEHINRPKLFLQGLSRCLANKGRVQIITPNGNQDLAYTRRAFKAGFPLTMLLNHILYFRPRTLEKALEKAGLKTQRLYCYDIRYTAKDMGWFGLAKPVKAPPPPSIEETLGLKANNSLSFWTKEKLGELKTHQKTSLLYGMLKEEIPNAFSLKVPPRWELGHEIYALAEKS